MPLKTLLEYSTKEAHSPHGVAFTACDKPDDFDALRRSCSSTKRSKSTRRCQMMKAHIQVSIEERAKNQR